MSNFIIVIPARYASTRLPGKVLLEIAGKSMLEHVFAKAKASTAQHIVIATDHEKVLAHAKSFGAEAILTSPEHTSGTSRLVEVVEHYGWSDETIIVNLQADEPLMEVALLNQLAQALAQHPLAAMASLYTSIESLEDFNNPHIVKVVMDEQGYALYFSRAPIPYLRYQIEHIKDLCYRHIGLYAYRVGFLKQYKQLKPSPLEQAESLEQLRVLSAGYKIYLQPACVTLPPGVDTEEDLIRVIQLLK